MRRKLMLVIIAIFCLPFTVNAFRVVEDNYCITTKDGRVYNAIKYIEIDVPSKKACRIIYPKRSKHLS